jgi:superfamily II DNA helicase RecQ
MREAEVRRAMQQVLRQAEVGFQSAQQEQAMYAVLSGQTPLVVVLPTGGGKSLLFTVPAFLEAGGVTVVVVPYRALIEDLVQRIQGCGVDCIE